MTTEKEKVVRREINIYEQDLFDPPRKFERNPSTGTSSESQDAIVKEAGLSDKQLASVLETVYTNKAQQEQEKRARRRVKQIMEALLFTSQEPLPLPKIRAITDPVHPLKPKVLYDLLNELKMEYITQQRAFRLEEIAQGFILRTCEEYSVYLEQLYGNKRFEKLSPAAIEVLAIIAYKQPVARSQIEAIRGVDCTGIIQTLLERNLIASVGRMDLPGRPTLYGSTKEFLKHFGLRDLNELPQVAPPSFRNQSQSIQKQEQEQDMQQRL